jgi:hypothetical protein
MKRRNKYLIEATSSSFFQLKGGDGFEIDVHLTMRRSQRYDSDPPETFIRFLS